MVWENLWYKPNLKFVSHVSAVNYADFLDAGSNISLYT
jgi:hypothetical protein